MTQPALHGGQSAAAGLAAAAGGDRRWCTGGSCSRRSSPTRTSARRTQKGIELGVDGVDQPQRRRVRELLVSGRARPRRLRRCRELNLPPKNRFNVGVNFNYDRFLGNSRSATPTSAFWQDVLDDRYHGTTDAYTLVNGGFGVKWADDKRHDVASKAIEPGEPGHPAAHVRRHHQAVRSLRIRVGFQNSARRSGSTAPASLGRHPGLHDRRVGGHARCDSEAVSAGRGRKAAAAGMDAGARRARPGPLPIPKRRKSLPLNAAWREARALILARRWRLALGPC